MAFEASTGRIVNPGLSISGESISLMDDNFKFLGMPVCVHKNNNAARTSLHKHLRLMLEAVDNSLVTRRQKLRLYRYGVCPRLSWPLLVDDFHITYVDRTPTTATCLKISK